MDIVDICNSGIFKETCGEVQQIENIPNRHWPKYTFLARMSIVVLPKQNPEICLLWCTALIINWNACKLMLKEFIGHELNPMLQIK